MLIVIRDMKREDWTEVSRIYSQALVEGNSTFQTECPSYEEWDAAHLKDGRYVILYGGQLVGWCAISKTSSRKAYEGVVEVSIYMDAQYRGKGLGTYLLEHLCSVTEQLGYWCLYAAIFSKNTASIALHKKCGFREIGYRERIARDRFGNWQSTTLLERRVKEEYEKN